MAGNQKIISALKHIEVKWLATGSFSLDNEDIGVIEIDAFHFNDDTIIGKVEYPFSLVIGKYIENKGAYFAILDAETGRLPHTVLASVAKDGKPKQFYGSIMPIDPNKDEQNIDNALVTITSKNLMKFEQESIADVSQKISFGSNIICSTESINNIIYNSMLNKPYEEYAQDILDIKTQLDKYPLSNGYQNLDIIEFGFGDK
jgi:hypothetical protein